MQDDTIIWDITHDDSSFLDVLKKNTNIKEVILFSLEESLNWDYLFDVHLSKKISLLGDLPFKLIVNDTCKYEKYKEVELIKLPAFLLKTAYQMETGQLVNDKWNYNSDKALILTGKAHNPNRIGLLVELVRAGILKNHIYSFFPPKEVEYKRQTIETFRKVCDWDYSEFCKEYENNPDDIDIRNNEEDMHYSGFPYSPTLFSETLISVISETNYSDNGNNPDFSEKTYKAIINRHPFLMLNQADSFPLLKQYGFYTFEDYMKIYDYDSIEDPFIKNKVVIQNLNYFIENYKKLQNEIDKKIEHNYNLMVKIYQDFKKDYPYIFDKLKEDFFVR